MHCGLYTRGYWIMWNRGCDWTEVQNGYADRPIKIRVLETLSGRLASLAFSLLVCTLMHCEWIISYSPFLKDFIECNRHLHMAFFRPFNESMCVSMGQHPYLCVNPFCHPSPAPSYYRIFTVYRCKLSLWHFKLSFKYEIESTNKKPIQKHKHSIGLLIKKKKHTSVDSWSIIWVSHATSWEEWLRMSFGKYGRK